MVRPECDTSVCPYCGAPVEGLKVCPWCGKPLVDDIEDIKETVKEDIEPESISSDTCNTAEESIDYAKDESILVDDAGSFASSSSIDHDKKKSLRAWHILLPVSVLLIAFICVVIVRNGNEYTQENEVESNVEAAPPRVSIQYVYSCAYDGFTNIREEASFSAKVIGQFRNGPEGAILLEDLGEWMKVDVSGQIGYVVSKYVRDTPSVAYTGDITVDWLEGIWDGGYALMIYNNGTWEMGYDYTFVYGTYILQNKNELVLIPVKKLDPDAANHPFVWIPAEESDIKIAKINKAEKRLDLKNSGSFEKGEYLSIRDEEEYYGYGFLTRSEFKSEGKSLLKLIETGTRY